MDIFPVKEYRAITVELDQKDVYFLRGMDSGRINLSPTGEINQFILQADSYVGFIQLPSGKTINIQPKIQIDTLFSIIARIYDPNNEIFQKQEQSFSTVHDFFEYVVAIFVEEVEDLIQIGVHKAYNTVSESLVMVKGQIQFVETWNRYPGRADQHVCRYDLFTANTLENKAIRYCCHQLKYQKYRQIDLAQRLQRIDKLFSPVDLDENVRQKIDQIELTRLTDRYRMPLCLARLLLDHLTYSGTVGESSFLSYLIDMNWLFQKYLTVLLDQASFMKGWKVHSVSHYPLDTQGLVNIEPDIVLYKNELPVLILDAKYKLSEHQEDMYQAIAYCHALSLEKAILVCPSSEIIQKGSRTIHGPSKIEIEYLDLSLTGDPSILESSEKTFIELVQQKFIEQHSGIVAKRNS